MAGRLERRSPRHHHHPPRLGPIQYERNPQFHPSALRRGPHSERLFRGSMIDFLRGTRTKRVLYFLYNPSVISFGYTLQPGLLPEANLTQAESIGEGVAQQSVSFSIIFNRMYEVAYGGNKDGVLMDIKAMEAMVQFTPEQPAIRVVPLKMIFGSNFAVTAVISSINVQYQLFSHNMVPYHCEVAIQGYRVNSLNPSGFDAAKIAELNNQKFGTGFSGGSRGLSGPRIASET